jgi:hypothetical protein
MTTVVWLSTSNGPLRQLNQIAAIKAARKTG